MNNRRGVLQFKISLKGISPPIWRRIQISDLSTFWALHVAIQDSMGWSDSHLHDFITTNPKTGAPEHIGIPEEVYGEMGEDYDTLASWDIKIKDYFSDHRSSMIYLYDFGDDWEHLIEFEGIREKGEKQKYPLCLDGERSCPPEDVGGIWGYKDFLKTIKNPSDPEYAQMKEWAGAFFTEKFDSNKVKFDNANQRLKKNLR
jgi:hypothetical protein